MALDDTKLFAKVTVSTGYDDVATSVVLSAGHGAKLPTPPFNAVWWNSTDYPDPADDPNVEVVRVTAIATDTLTVTRSQETSNGAPAASTKNTAGKTYKMIAGLTAKLFDVDLPATYAQLAAANIFTADQDIRANARFKGHPHIDVLGGGFTRSGSGSSTTTTGTISSGSNSLAVASASGWSVNMGIGIILDNNTLFTSYVTAIAGTTFTLNDNAPSGATAKAVYHDDTLAFQDAEDFGSSQARVFAGGGNYYISSLSLKSNVPFVGGGHGVTVLKSLPGNTAAAMILLATTGQSDCQLHRVTLDGNKAASPAPTCGGIYYQNTGQTAFRRHQTSDVRIISCKGDGIKLVSNLGSQFYNVVVEACDGHGLWNDAACLHNQFSNVQLRNNGLNGVHEFGFQNTYSNLLAYGNGQVDAVGAGAGIKINNGASNINAFGFQGMNNLLANIWFSDSDAVVATTVNIYGVTFQSLAAYHVLVTNGIGGLLRLMAGSNDAGNSLALSLLTMNGGSSFDIAIGYAPSALTANAKPAQGAARLDASNRIDCSNGNTNVQLLPGKPLVAYRRVVIPAGGRWFIDGDDNSYSPSVLKIVTT